MIKYLFLLLALISCSKKKECHNWPELIQTFPEVYEDDIKECRVVLVYVGADWCPPCKPIHEYLDKAAVKWNQVRFLYIDVTKNSDAAEKIKIGNDYIPFVRLYVDDKIRYDGNIDVNKLDEILRGTIISLFFITSGIYAY